MRKFAVAILALVLIAGCAAPRPRSEADAVIRRVKGDADLALAGEPFHEARRGQRVTTGAIARTGLHGTIDFHLGVYGGVLTLHPDSTLEFEQIGTGNDPQVAAVLRLSRGRVTGDTLQMPDGTKIVVETPAGTHRIP